MVNSTPLRARTDNKWNVSNPGTLSGNKKTSAKQTDRNAGLQFMRELQKSHTMRTTIANETFAIVMDKILCNESFKNAVLGVVSSHSSATYSASTRTVGTLPQQAPKAQGRSSAESMHMPVTGVESTNISTDRGCGSQRPSGGVRSQATGLVSGIVAHAQHVTGDTAPPPAERVGDAAAAEPSLCNADPYTVVPMRNEGTEDQIAAFDTKEMAKLINVR